MEYSGEGVGVYAEAKGEYTKQLCQYLVPALHTYFLDLLEEAKQKEPEPKKVLLKFQGLLEEVTEWNIDKVQRETDTVIKNSQCDYLSELLTAVFIAHTKVLSAIQLTVKQKKLQIIIPKLNHFLHRTITECARILWSNTYLFSPNAPSLERQKNLRQIETFLNDGILQSIRSMLPIKDILKTYLTKDDGNGSIKDEEEDEDDEDDEEEEEEEEKPKKKGKGKKKKEEGNEEEEEEEGEPETKKEEVPPVEKVMEADAPVAPVEGTDAPSSQAEPTLVVDTSVPPPLPTFTGNDTNELVEGGGDLEGGAVLEDADEEEDLSEQIIFTDDAPQEMDGFEDITPATSAPAAPKSLFDSDELPMEFDESI